MRRLLGFTVLAALLQIAAVGDSSFILALQIAGVINAAAPLPLKYVNARWHPSRRVMVAISFVLAALVALGSVIYTGEWRGIDFTSIGALIITAGFAWSIQQGVFHAFSPVFDAP